MGIVAHLQPCGCVLAHDDGVIDDDPEHHDQRKQRHHVDGLPRGVHEADGGEHCHRNTGGDPECDPGIEKQEQDCDDDQQAAKPVLDQKPDARRQRVRGDFIGGDFDAGRQLGGDLVNIG